MNECIENNYPFEKHIYIFNKNDMNNFGKYDISKSSSYCWLTKIEMLETLSVMRVTDNYLDFGETHPMKINKNTTTDVIRNLKLSHHPGKVLNLSNFLSISKITRNPKARTKLCIKGIMVDKSASKTGATLNQSKNTLSLLSDET